MTDIHELKKGDRIVFTNGHESLVHNVFDDVGSLNVCFTNEKGKELDLFFLKEYGIELCIEYEIAKVIHA